MMARLLCATALTVVMPASQAFAQAVEDPAESIVDSGQPSTERVFEPEYFAASSPRNALDMIDRLPGFAIADGNNNGPRGLGQANQNVLVNGERFSSKSDSLRDQLRRIPASTVVRIELIDGNTLDIPGLTGLVANVVTADANSGQFRWQTGFRPHNTDARLYGGEASLTGKSGSLGYTVAISNENNRFGADGPVVITAADGSLIEEQYRVMSGGFDNPKLATNFSYDFDGSAQANLNLSYAEDFYYVDEPEVGKPSQGPVRSRDARVDEDGPQYEIGGDLTFALGPGKLKLIGLERFERDNYTSTVIDSFSDGSPVNGFRFSQFNEIGERIGRLEYNWPMWSGEWQVSGEAAYNQLNRVSSLAELGNSGEFVAVPYPQGNGGVHEDRYETGVSYSRNLSSTLSMQAIGTIEFSTIEQTGSAANSRRFTRPKGSVAATWKPSPNLDLSLTLARRVSQLSFGDFLASLSLNDENEREGNNQLVPYQSWNLELEANRRFGAWGSVKFEVRQGWFEDFIDWFPIEGGGEARGNIGDADRLHLELTGTLNLDPIGVTGARFDVTAVQRWMRVTDAFTGDIRAFSNDQNALLEIDFRHDVPSSDWAWGANIFSEDNASYWRRYEVGREWEGPVFGSLFVEHKDVLGLTVKAQAGNLLGARNRFERTVYAGPRPDAPIRYREEMDRRIGPIFTFTVSGEF